MSATRLARESVPARDPKRIERLWRDRPQFAAQAAAATVAGPLAVTAVKAWRLKESVGGRRYTVVKVTAQNGVSGYGEGGPVRGVELADAKAKVMGRRASELEFFRHALVDCPPAEAAISNACLDLLARHGKVPL